MPQQHVPRSLVHSARSAIPAHPSLRKRDSDTDARHDPKSRERSPVTEPAFQTTPAKSQHKATSFFRSLHCEQITDPSNGSNHLASTGQFPPQVADVHIECPIVRRGLAL